MSSIQIDNLTLRNIAIQCQLLQQKSENGSENIIENIFDRLGYVQIDTINIIERAHHHTLWVRKSSYNQEMLQNLQAKERKIFEYWSHAMSYIPMNDYRYFLPKMHQFAKPSHPWVMNMYKNGKHLLQPVLDRIRSEGPLTSKDFKRQDNKKGGTWWDWKPAKFALEYLFWRGDLMISERRNFQKVYDLTERVLPSNVDTRIPDQKEIAEHLVKRGLRSMGIASKKEIQKFMQPDAARDSDFQAVDRNLMSQTIEDLFDAGVIVAVEIEGDSKNEYYALSDSIENFNCIQEFENTIHFLSPFDNLIIQRDRVKRLFDFDYTLECYVPAPKRVHGYFVLPILFGNSLIGRIDPKADRKSKTLILNNVSFEEGFEPSDEFLEKFSFRLMEFAAFNQCDTIVIEKIKPAKLKVIFKSAVKKVAN